MTPFRVMMFADFNAENLEEAAQIEEMFRIFQEHLKSQGAVSKKMIIQRRANPDLTERDILIKHRDAERIERMAS